MRYFPKNTELTISVPLEKEKTISLLYKFELELPLCNKGCEKPARWMKFPKVTNCYCLSNVLCVDDTDPNHTILINNLPVLTLQAFEV